MPQLICDSCIIQLNVAYNFKQKAIETDTSMRQYVIENGLSIPPIRIMQNELIRNNCAGKSTPTPSVFSNYRHRPFVLDQFNIKSEPFDYEILSDITIDTNTETEDAAFQQRNGEVSTPSINLNIDTSSSNSSPSSTVQLPVVNSTISGASMVKLNDINLLKTATNADMDFISNYMEPSAINGHSIIDASSTHSPKVSSESELIVANTKVSKNAEEQPTTQAIEPSKKVNRFSRRKSISQESKTLSKQTTITQSQSPYLFRSNKSDEQKSINKDTRKWKINPANRVRQTIKSELLSNSLSPVKVSSAITKTTEASIKDVDENNPLDKLIKSNKAASCQLKKDKHFMSASNMQKKRVTIDKDKDQLNPPESKRQKLSNNSESKNVKKKNIKKTAQTTAQKQKIKFKLNVKKA